MAVKVVIDQAALNKLLTGPDGPAVKHMARVGAKVEGTAKQLLSGEMVDVDGGRLRSGTTWKPFTRGDQIGVSVASSVNYALVVHEGGTFQVKSHTRKNRGGKGSHTVRSHQRTVVSRPYLIEAARRNGLKVKPK